MPKRVVMRVWLLLAWACARAPAVRGVEPNEVSPGDPVRVRVAPVGPAATVALIGTGGRVALEVRAVHEDRAVDVVIPWNAGPGRYDLEVVSEGRSDLLPGALVVRDVPEDLPCDGDATVTTQVALSAGRIWLERVYTRGPREGTTTRSEVGIDDLAAVEAGAVTTADGRSCSVIVARAEDGRRWILDDDDAIDLGGRAARLATDLGRPLEPLGPPRGP